MLAQIGIVDRGIDRDHPAFRRRKPKGVGVQWQGGGYRYIPDYNDCHGHGTAIALRIHAFCRAAWLYAVRIAQHDETRIAVRVPEQALAMGIEACVNEGIRIINVSYSIAEAREDGHLARACRRAEENGAIVVAAYRNGEEGPVYPAAFPRVLGVRRDGIFEPGQVAILSEENHDLFAFGGSNSMACAQVSAMVGRIHTVDDSYGFEEVFAFLKEVAIARSEGDT